MLLGLLGALWIGCAQGQENQDKQLRSPRATVRTLLTAITLSRGVPHRIEEAAASSGPARRLAEEDHPISARRPPRYRAGSGPALSDIDTSLIPDDIKEAAYVALLRPTGDGQRIALTRMPDGRWLFDPETVAQIPKLYAETQKRREEKNREAAALNVSVDFASPRATMRTLIEAYRHGNVQRVLA